LGYSAGADDCMDNSARLRVWGMSVYLYLGVGGGAARDIQIEDTPSVIIAGVVRVLIKRLI